jgi:sugar phosphate isomerase/epimerase
MTPRIGVQLYSVRSHIRSDLDATLARLAEIGFEGVEPAFVEEDKDADFKAFKERLDAHGFTVACAHVDVPIGPNREPALRQAEALGTSRLVWHGWPEDPRYGSEEGIAEMILEYRAAADVAESEGYTFGIHNHWWELRPVNDRIPLEILADALDNRIFFELDVYWASVTGLDPKDVVSKLDGRVPLVHVKDGPLGDVDAPMVALGEGRVDLDGTLAAVESADWWVVEFDSCETDIFEALAKSYAYLAARGVATGGA